jgi:hypothetical protein
VKQNQLMLLLAAAGAALAYYFYSKRRVAPSGQSGAAAAPRFAGSIAPSATGLTYVPVAPAPTTTRYAGAPVPSFTTGLAIAGQNTLAQILGRLSNAGLNALGAGGGGGRGSGFGIGGGGSPGNNNNNRNTGNTGNPGSGAPPPAPTSTGTYMGQDQSSQYYTDPATGIVYDSSGNPVSGLPTDAGIPYQPDTSAIQSFDIPPNPDSSVSSDSGSGDSVPTDYNYGDPGAVY